MKRKARMKAEKVNFLAGLCRYIFSLLYHEFYIWQKMRNLQVTKLYNHDFKTFHIQQTMSEAPVKEIEALSIKEPAANGTAPKTTQEASSTAPTNSESSTASFKDQFKAFSKFGDVKSDGKLITLSQSDKWMKQAQASFIR